MVGIFYSFWFYYYLKMQIVLFLSKLELGHLMFLFSYLMTESFFFVVEEVYGLKKLYSLFLKN